MNRYDFQRLAEIRLREAKTLLSNGHYEGCYYLSGYAVKFGLKACIAKLTKRYDFPDKGLVQSVYTHDLTKLIVMAKLEALRILEMERDPELLLNWYLVKEWSEHSRYETRSREQAESLFKAVADRKHGLLRWIKRYW